MKLHLESTSVTLDIDPEDLSDDALRECVRIAGMRGVAPPLQGDALELQLAIERCFASLMSNNPAMAVAQIAPYVARDQQVRAIQAGIFAARSARSAPNGLNGHRPPPSAPRDPAKLPQP